MSAVQSVKKELGNDLEATQKLTEQTVQNMFKELNKGQSLKPRNITLEQAAEAVVKSVDGLTEEQSEMTKQLFMSLAGSLTKNEKGINDE